MKNGSRPKVRKVLWKRTSTLKVHPLNKRVYGAPRLTKDFLESVKLKGILEPLTVNEKDQVVSGVRRLAAARKLRMKRVPTLAYQGSRLESESFVIQANKQRQKTKAQIAREFHELKRIESALAKERMSEGGKLKGRAKLPNPGRAGDKAAALGKSRRTCENLEKRYGLARSKAKVHHKSKPKPSRLRTFVSEIETLVKKLPAALKAQKKAKDYEGLKARIKSLGEQLLKLAGKPKVSAPQEIQTITR